MAQELAAITPNNPYGFPLSRTGIPIVQGMSDNHVLGSHDIVGTTFWIACAAMLAGSVFFFTERSAVPEKWKTSVTVAGLITGIAFWNYCYMRESWVLTQNSPTVYRYTDWLITVPLQIVEFYLILKAVMPNLSSGLFYRLMGQAVAMLAFGYMGESGIVSVLCGFIPGVLCWLALCYEMFAGECSQINAGSGNKASQQAFQTLRLIISVGWCIYPLGYYLTLLGPTSTYHDQSIINIVYNLADLVNKLAFGLAIWGAAITDK
jgi:bacteriorhodopsin